jgi:predicted kinase
VLLVVSGLPGTGKSTVADALAGRLHAVRVSVDAIQEGMLASGLPASWSTGAAAYGAGAAVAGMNLSNGATVVVDAVNDSEAARDTWRSAAARAEADVLDRASSYEAWSGGDSLGIDAGSPIGEVVEQVLTHLRTG